MLYDVHIAELKPKESYELRIDRFIYPLNHSQLIDLHNSILTLLKEGEQVGDVESATEPV